MKELTEKITKLMLKETKEKLVELKGETKLDGTQKIEPHMEGDIAHVMIPSSMSLLQGSYSLLQRFEEEEKTQVFTSSFGDVFLNDIVLTMKKIIPDIFGKIINSKYDTEGNRAGNQDVSFIIDHKSDGTPINESGFIGSVICPPWEDAILDITPFGLKVLAKKKYEKNIRAFFDKVGEYMKSMSVVKGKAVSVRKIRAGMLAEPVFVKKHTKIVLNDDTKRIIENLIIPSLGERQKKTLLFTGDFGTYC